MESTQFRFTGNQDAQALACRAFSYPNPVHTDQIFEQQVLPPLFRQLHQHFAILPLDEREDAVQDGVCIAYEAWKMLRMDTILCREEAVVNLAKYASDRYLHGVRFAAV